MFSLAGRQCKRIKWTPSCKPLGLLPSGWSLFVRSFVIKNENMVPINFWRSNYFLSYLKKYLRGRGLKRFSSERELRALDGTLYIYYIWISPHSPTFLLPNLILFAVELFFWGVEEFLDPQRQINIGVIRTTVVFSFLCELL